ncbi:MAG TPA: 30S ribosomal protein S30 [Chitinophagaceae bacterium]|jgi:putative sigma-54 modulation protein|nr:30S ribosomal protein S30 [Chitinophagaceae bacterium]HAN38182.1 30S ribosomal protein S30 [Chitinophagaceae bacterium]
MNVNIQTVHFDADAKLLDYVSQKVKKLDTFHDKIIKVDVFLKLDNVVHTIKDKIVEIRVHVPKYDFFVKASSKSFEESFDSAMESMINQIKRKKEKQIA